MLTGFVATPARFEVTQARALEWLATAHAEAEAAAAGLDEAGKRAFAEKLARVIARVACAPAKINKRGHSVIDIANARWDTGELYDLRRHPGGRGSAARTRLFRELVDAYFAATYARESTAPDDLVHVTCTGYALPTGAQKLVARRGWGASTRVTNAYHMGCYAAIPALRIARGFRAAGARRVDIVHTELCSLHLQPTDHSLEQLVIESLFGDGFIRYSLVAGAEAGLRVLALHEQIIPDSTDAMTWSVGDAGMAMTLSRDVPDRVAGAIRAFVGELAARAGLHSAHLRDAVFAVHPGGPKIIDEVCRVLELAEPQVAASRAVLFHHGNMSSATLPTIWLRILADPDIPRGALVPSLAFGPGLTVCGALLEKR